MVQISTLFVASIAISVVSAMPAEKRIAQTITDATTKWVAACTSAGGAEKCQPISQTGFDSLLAAGGNCDQQNAADSMIDLAKTLNNDPEMIKQAQIFVQQPRNSPNSVQIPYCQTAPKNSELNGLFHCQFAGTTTQTPPAFAGDQTGNLPLGVNAVNPVGSCPAKTDGPVPDGQQLSQLVDSPGAVGGAAAGGGNASASGSGSASAAATDAAATDATSSTAAASGGAVPSTTAASGGTASSSTDAAAAPSSTDAAAVDNAASAAGGAAGYTTAAAPSSTVASTAGVVAGSATATTSSAVASTTGAAAGGAAAGGAAAFVSQNGKDAQALNLKFASLDAKATCNEGDQACVSGGFAQCVGGKFVSTPCASPTVCLALPLVNKAGTSITCTTSDDGKARIAATGATGGLTGQDQ